MPVKGLGIDIEIPKLRPANDLTFVVTDAASAKTKGGLFIPQIAQKWLEDTVVGTVVAIGKGWYGKYGVFHPCELKNGDRVLIKRLHAGWLQQFEDGTCLIFVHERDIIGEVIEEASEQTG